MASHRAGDGCFVIWGDDQELQHPFDLVDLITRQIDFDWLTENVDILEGVKFPHAGFGLLTSL